MREGGDGDGVKGLGMRWGTWEELLLGGAVLRHGSNSWDAVAADLNARTPNATLSSSFTPLECQSKYDEIQALYSGCNAWFEELRKRRVAELKRELERSEDSIGSLQSKLESLTSDTRETGSNFGYNASNTESTSPREDADGVDSSSKEVSRDGSSSGSFTNRLGREWACKHENSASVSFQVQNLKPQFREDSSKERFGCGCLGIGFGIFKKKRGKRKRKGCNIVKEGSIGDSDMLSSAAFVNSEGSADGCNQDTKLPSEDCGETLMDEDDTLLDLSTIMDLVMKHKDGSVFRVQPESQKKARYKKMIRRHVDLCNIKSKIANGSISSAKELFRDLLLLCNNALVFYPNNSSEHKSALLLRDFVNKSLRRRRFSSHSCSDDEGAIAERVVKPRRQRSMLQHHRVAKKGADTGNGDATPAKENTVVAGKADGNRPHMRRGNKVSGADMAAAAAESQGKKKRGIGRPVKGGGQRGGRRRHENPKMEKKRARR